MTTFRSRRRPEESAAYVDLLAEIEDVARRMPGFVDYKSFVADDGERVSLVTFASMEDQRAWREDVGHRAAQRQGRDQFYLEYSLQVGACTHVSQWATGE
jgi:heme-degrading monooxygenase HmoA